MKIWNKFRKNIILIETIAVASIISMFMLYGYWALCEHNRQEHERHNMDTSVVQIEKMNAYYDMSVYYDSRYPSSDRRYQTVSVDSLSELDMIIINSDVEDSGEVSIQVPENEGIPVNGKRSYVIISTGPERFSLYDMVKRITKMRKPDKLRKVREIHSKKLDRSFEKIVSKSFNR